MSLDVRHPPERLGRQDTTTHKQGDRAMSLTDTPFISSLPAKDIERAKR